MTDDTAYPPLNTPKALAEGLWVVDATPIVASGVLTLPVRMVVIRLGNGDILLHSPTEFRSTLKTAIEKLGPIRHLVAPSCGHWMFAEAWKDACPDAKMWGPRQLGERKQVQASGLHLDAFLGAESPPEWADEITQVLFEGGADYVEVNFFHKPSRTLLVCDTLLNVEAHRLPLASRALATTIGICAPDGKAPLQLRALLLMKRAQAARAAERLISLGPERIVVAHGTIIEHDAVGHLERSLGWLSEEATDRAISTAGLAAVGLLGSLAVGLTLWEWDRGRRSRRRSRARRWLRG